MRYEAKKGDFTQLGASQGRKGANFCMVGRKEACCKILIYERDQETCTEEIVIPNEFFKGNLRSAYIEGLDLSKYDYNFCIDGRIVLDPYARRIVGRDVWADTARDLKTALRCRYEPGRFLWKGDCGTEILRKDMVLYKLHVRGFTMGLAEGTADRGTFRALMKKIPYLKSLGVTSVELMPVYEFEELIPLEREKIPEYTRWKSKKKDKVQKPERKPMYRINYWGYGEGMYFAPKASYAAGEDPGAELKELIAKFHKNGMECILEMDFPETVAARQIADVLRFWVEEYHVDGFHLQGNQIPIAYLLEDPYLGRTKLFYRGLSEQMIATAETEFPRVFLDTDEFLYPCRKLVNKMDGNVWELANQMKKQNERLGHINYIADNNGFTLRDLFYYGRKHNEANGEDNTDGPVWNYNTNCGVEGETSSRNVQKIRERRMRNIAATLFLAQGVPMLMAGDEDGNSQQGNNNAYCQDNPVGWKDWKKSRSSREFFKYVKSLIAFRREHAILRMERPMQMSDMKSYGFPDLSYHEEAAWIPRGYCNREALGILYHGEYAGEKEDVYIGFNFSDFPKGFALPKQKEGRGWHLLMNTALKTAFLSEPEALKATQYILEAQSVCIIIGK